MILHGNKKDILILILFIDAEINDNRIDMTTCFNNDHQVKYNPNQRRFSKIFFSYLNCI